MNYETFDNDAPNTSNEDYYAFVKWIEQRTSDELRQVIGNPAAQKLALCRYYKRGLMANLTPSELIDFLPLDAAEYSESEVGAVMAISDALTDEEIESVVLD